jgi:hypothetical protein
MMRPFFSDVVVTDGDTRGLHKCIQMQRDIMGKVAEGIAEQLPDFGRFVKCLSNGLYKKSTLRGKGMNADSYIRMDGWWTIHETCNPLFAHCG